MPKWYSRGTVDWSAEKSPYAEKIILWQWNAKADVRGKGLRHPLSFLLIFFFPLRGKTNGIREIFADLEAKLHEIVCRETANTERRSEKDLTKSDLIPWLRELESMLIRSTHHIRFSESPRTEISLFKSVYMDVRQNEWKYAVIRVENQGFSSL